MSNPKYDSGESTHEENSAYISHLEETQTKEDNRDIRYAINIQERENKNLKERIEEFKRLNDKSHDKLYEKIKDLKDDIKDDIKEIRARSNNFISGKSVTRGLIFLGTIAVAVTFSYQNIIKSDMKKEMLKIVEQYKNKIDKKVDDKFSKMSAENEIITNEKGEKIKSE